MTQFSIPCTVYRGGSSRGLFFNKQDLPEEYELQRKIFMNGIDAYNPSQINGLGSGTSHTSKVCVISKSSNEQADIDFTFYQIGIGEEIVDNEGTCGNLMAAVGAFAIDEGLLNYDPTTSIVAVRVYNTNINKILHITVPVENGKSKVTGDYFMPGVVQSGAKYSVNILHPGGTQTGYTLPLGARYSIVTKQKTYTISFVDVVNPFVFIAADELGLEGTETIAQLEKNQLIQKELEEIRLHTAVASGMAKTIDEAKKIGSVPKLAIVSHPQDYSTTKGSLIKEEQVDIVSKMISMGKFHRTFAGSGLYCLAAASLLTDTIPNSYCKKQRIQYEQLLRIGHPEGVVEVNASLTNDGLDISSVGLNRTARRIMKGKLFIPESVRD